MGLLNWMAKELVGANKPTADEPVRCPKCGSSQLTANKRGFNFKKAALAGLVLTPFAGVAGFHGRNRVVITCLKCNKTFTPG